MNINLLRTLSIWEFRLRRVLLGTERGLLIWDPRMTQSDKRSGWKNYSLNWESFKCHYRKAGIDSSTNTKWINKSNECQRWIQRTWLKYDLIITVHWPPMTLYNINRLKFGISAVDSIFYGDDKGCIHLVELSLNDLALRPIKSEEEDGFIINFLRFVKLWSRKNEFGQKM